MNPLETLITLVQMQLALKDALIPVSKSCVFPLSAVALYENREVLDDKGKLTGEVVQVITLTSGNEIELTTDQNRIFQMRVNEKVDIDDKIRAFVKAIDAQLFPAPAASPVTT